MPTLGSLYPPQRSTIEIGSLLGDPLRGDPLDLGACGAEGAAANKGFTSLRAFGAPAVDRFFGISTL